MKKISKTITSLITAISMTVFVTSESVNTLIKGIKTKAATNIIYGDLDNNKEINSFDIVYMRRLLNDSVTEKNEADLNAFLAV